MPRLLDRWLAHTGYESQQTDGPVAPDRPENLWDPVPGDDGAHGDFDHRARPFSVQLWLSRHRRMAAVAGAATAAIAAAVARYRAGTGRAAARAIARKQ